MKPTINEIEYKMSESYDERFNMSNGLEEDFACFALWEGALNKEEEILSDLRKNFSVLANFLIHWTEENYSRNIERLYERHGATKDFQGYSSKLGKPPFRVFIVKDHNPSYTWKRSVSGVIEPSNERVVAAKYRYRDLFDKPYQVHSSNNTEEFLVQSSLIFGRENLEKILTSPSTQEGTLYKDLEGSEGWKDWQHLFSTINPCCRYLVLRNFESLPANLEDEDIDFLTDNVQRFASAANVMQDSSRAYKGTLKVSGMNVPTDIRFLGDNYFSSQWQQSVLSRRRKMNGLYIPAKDDYFFTLLYHAKVHKLSVKPKYFDVLSKLAEEMRFDWFDSSELHDNSAMGGMLAGYFRANQYRYEDPVDGGVGRNSDVIEYLPKYDGSEIKKSKLHKKYGKILRLIISGLRQPYKVPAYIMRRADR